MGVGKIIQIVGVVAAIAAGLIGGFPQSAVLVAVIGAVGGYFVEDDDRMRFLIATLALGAVSGALGAIPVIGEHISNALGGGGLLALYQAGAVTVIVKAVVEYFKP
jgi:hypothetical protein